MYGELEGIRNLDHSGLFCEALQGLCRLCHSMASTAYQETISNQQQIPDVSGTLRFTNDYDQDEAGLCRDIFRQHGWPGKYYRKDECLKAIKKLKYGDLDED